MLTFDLRNAKDLREKMRRELTRLEATPLDTDCAYNFFVTAEHMPDWVHPKRAGRKDREKLRESDILLEVCSHLANGLKHLQVEAKQHVSVVTTRKTGGLFDPLFPGFPRRLVVILKGKAAKELGQTIAVVELAKMIMAYWDKQTL